MDQELPLIPERAALLEWIGQQPKPVSLEMMDMAQAPGYSRKRVNELHDEGLLESTGGVNHSGKFCWAYYVSDKGKALLLMQQKMADKDAEDKAHRETEYELQRENISQAKRSYRLTLFQTILALVSFVMGLITEHYAGLVGLIESFFRRLGR